MLHAVDTTLVGIPSTARRTLDTAAWTTDTQDSPFGRMPTPMNSPSTIRLDRDALDDNLDLIRRLTGPDGAVCGVVKANAYGLGADRIVPRMVASNVDMLAVYSLAEAAEIAAMSSPVPLLVLMAVHELDRGAATLSLLAHDRLHLVVHDLDHLASLEREVATFGFVLRLHLELDTGMGRGGCSTSEAAAVLQRIAVNPRLELHGIMTHFADSAADRESAREQRSLVLAFSRDHAALIPKNCRLHAAATGALDDSAMRLDMVRVGLAWTGLVDGTVAGQPPQGPLASLRSIVSLWSEVVQVRHIEAGKRVGYGSLWEAKRRSTIGIVPVGYAHGLPAPQRGHTHRLMVATPSGPREVPVIGAVNMDQVSVDLTDVGPIGRGAAVEVLSSDRSSPAYLAKVANRTGLSPYAIVTGLSPRLPRVMVAGHDSSEAMPNCVVDHSLRISHSQ